MPHTRSGGLRRFLREAGRNWQQTGAVLPSSARLAKAMTTPLSDYRLDERPKRILEVGAGTGAMTRELLRKMGPDDELVIYELSAELARVLKASLEANPTARRRNIEVRVCAFPERLGDEVYDFAVCSLPFNNFPSTEVRRILKTFSDCLEGGGILTFFEYCHLRQLKLRVSSGKEAMRLRRIQRLFDEYLATYRISSKTVRLNVPPAWVHILRFE